VALGLAFGIVACRQSSGGPENPDPGHLRAAQWVDGDLQCTGEAARAGAPAVCVYPSGVVSPAGEVRDVTNLQWALDNVSPRLLADMSLEPPTVFLQTTDPDDGAYKAFFLGTAEYTPPTDTASEYWDPTGNGAVWIGQAVRLVGAKLSDVPGGEWDPDGAYNVDFASPDGVIRSDRPVVLGGGISDSFGGAGMEAAFNMAATRFLEFGGIRGHHNSWSLINVRQCDGALVHDNVVTEPRPLSSSPVELDMATWVEPISFNGSEGPAGVTPLLGHIEVRDNHVSGTWATLGADIVLVGIPSEATFEITRNTLRYWGGITIQSSPGPTAVSIHDNAILEAEPFGISIEIIHPGSGERTLEGAEIFDNTLHVVGNYGILMGSASGHIVQSNTFAGAADSGVFLYCDSVSQVSADNTFTGNDFSQLTVAGAVVHLGAWTRENVVSEPGLTCSDVLDEGRDNEIVAGGEVCPPARR